MKNTTNAINQIATLNNEATASFITNGSLPTDCLVVLVCDDASVVCSWLDDIVP